MKKICKHPGCSRYALEGHSRCEKHLSDEESKFFVSGKSEWDFLYRTSRWQKLKEGCLLENPVCQKCGRAQSEEVHHMVPHRGDEDLFYDKDNLVALCHECHTSETLKEINDRRRERALEREIKKRYKI